MVRLAALRYTALLDLKPGDEFVMRESVAVVMRVLATQVRFCGSRKLTFLQPLAALGWSTTVRSGIEGPVIQEGLGIRIGRDVVRH